MPDLKNFDFAEVMSPEDIPAALGLSEAGPPQPTAEGLVWDKTGSFTKIEVKNADLRIDGGKIYEVSINVPPAAPPLKKDKETKPASPRRKRR